MAIASTTDTTSAINAAMGKGTNPKGILGKDDFLKLLLTQLQYQDPTSPMDTEKILSQTSQLATLESSDNTKNALEKLSTTLGTAQQFSTISAIGKTADLGSDAISYTKDASANFELYFPKSVEEGNIEITNANGESVGSIDVGTNPSGVYQFTWDGKTISGESAESGVYHVNATYTDEEGNQQKTKLGAYPIESVRFEDGKALVKVGSSYVPLDNIKELF